MGGVGQQRKREKIKGGKKDREGKEELKNNCIWCIFAYFGIDVIEHLHRCEGTRLLFIVQVHVNGVEEERGGRVRNRAQVSNLTSNIFIKIAQPYNRNSTIGNIKCTSISSRERFI